jgi:tellurite resistance protein TehA-like permease
MTFLDTSAIDIAQGGWLLAIVGTQSLVLLGVRAEATVEAAMYVFFLALWAVGLALYAVFVTLLSHRLFASRVRPRDISPVLWVVMGAAAITVNAGSTLASSALARGLLQGLHPFINGISFVLWGWGTWWIPLLAVFAVWKHGIHREPLGYAPSLWSIVFPLGMYAVATRQLAQTADLSPLLPLSSVMAWVALAAWGVTAVGLVSASVRSFRQFRRSAAFDGSA